MLKKKQGCVEMQLSFLCPDFLIKGIYPCWNNRKRTEDMLHHLKTHDRPPKMNMKMSFFCRIDQRLPLVLYGTILADKHDCLQ